MCFSSASEISMLCEGAAGVVDVGGSSFGVSSAAMAILNEMCILNGVVPSGRSENYECRGNGLKQCGN